MRDEFDLWREFEGLTDTVDPQLERWALGELATSEETALQATDALSARRLALLDIYRPMTTDEIRAARPGPPSRRGLKRRRYTLPLMALAAGFALLVVATLEFATSSTHRVVVRIQGPTQPVEDRAIVDLRIEVSAPAQHVGLWIESQGRWVASGARLEAHDGVWQTRARAGRLTNGHFGRMSLLAVVGGLGCERPRSAEEAAASGCAVTRWPLTVGPPPVQVEVATVELTVLGAADEDPAAGAIIVPRHGKIRLRLTHPEGPIAGDITYHVWRRSPSIPWVRLTTPEGLASAANVHMELDAARLLVPDAREGELRIEGGPAHESRSDPDRPLSKAWRATTLKLVRGNER